MQSISQFQLTNDGGFDCKGGYVDPDGNSRTCTGAFPNPETKTYNPGDSGAQDGQEIQMWVDVVWGDNNTGGEKFPYDSSSVYCAQYKITGTTLDNSLTYLGTVERG